MNIIVSRCCNPWQQPVRSVSRLIRRLLVSIAVLWLSMPLLMSQEPVVVTTVNRPVKTQMKTDTIPAGTVPVILARDTTEAIQKKSTGMLDGLTPHSNSIISYDRISAGLGLGLDYGGLGANILLYPHKNIGLFFGLGYNFVKTGVNSGIKARVILGNSRFSMALAALTMYGYNTAIKIQNNPDLNKVFYGFSFGIGIDYKLWEGTDDYGFTGLYLPVRSREVQEYIDNLSGYGVVFDSKLSPVLIAIGYRITIR